MGFGRKEALVAVALFAAAGEPAYAQESRFDLDRADARMDYISEYTGITTEVQRELGNLRLFNQIHGRRGTSVAAFLEQAVGDGITQCEYDPLTPNAPLPTVESIIRDDVLDQRVGWLARSVSPQFTDELDYETIAARGDIIGACGRIRQAGINYARRLLQIRRDELQGGQ